MTHPIPEAEAELERFRRQWREEVSARNKQSGQSSSGGSIEECKSQKKRDIAPPISSTHNTEADRYSEDIEPRVYHDLPDKETTLRLGEEGQNHDRHIVAEPFSALEHYEHAVEKESKGQLGDSIKHYRRAFRLDEGVHEAYKKKHFPPSSFTKPKPTDANPSDASANIRSTAHHSLHDSPITLSPNLRQLVEQFSSLRIEAAPPPTDASPQEPCRLAELPEEILTQVLHNLAIADVASFTRLAQVCKRLAFLVLTEESVWKRVVTGSEFGFGAMLYDYVCSIEGRSLSGDEILNQASMSHDAFVEDDQSEQEPRHQPTETSALNKSLLRSAYSDSWRHMFRSRPRIRFNGCYISTVNYTRAGATSTTTLTWGTPVHVVTYFRYLRFFRDGTAISLLTTSEPADVVHHLTKDNLHNHHGNVLPSSVMKDALRGRWRLTGPAYSEVDPMTREAEVEGDVHIETEGVVPKYTYKMILALAHAGKSARNNKLAWKSFWSHNRLTDDWGEFRLKNDRAFYWSRVKSYHDAN